MGNLRNLINPEEAGRNEVDNLRPISLMGNLGKICMKIVKLGKTR